MPQSVDSGDRKLLIGAGVALIVLVSASALLSPPKTSRGSGIPSSYSATWDGAKGAFLLLQDLGYQVERWEQPPTEITGNASEEVLILAEPIQPPSHEERSAIRDFLDRGGRVLATNAAAAQFLPDAPTFEEGDALEDEHKFAPLLPSPLMRDAPEIQMVSPRNWQPKSPSQLVIYGNAETAAVMTYPVGKGQVIWWGAATPLTNGRIRDSDNLVFFLNSVGPAQGTRVLWDEYFHGAHGSLWTYFARTPLPWAIAQFGLIFLAILLTYSRRQGPVHIPRKLSRLSPLEFVETLGDLYSSAHAGSTAVKTAYQRLRFLLTRQLGLPANVPVAELAQIASQSLGWKPEPLFDALTRAERGMNTLDLKEEASLQLVQEIFDYMTRLSVGHSRSEERQTG